MNTSLDAVMRRNERSPECNERVRKSKRTSATRESHDPEESLDEPPKKKKRVVKPNADKKFECRHEGCGKSYSRAEHLYRHQLNHTPKQIFRCDFPDCHRYFVRQDLCVRHRERHTTQGSQLHKRDSFTQSSTADGTAKHGSHLKATEVSRSLSPELTPHTTKTKDAHTGSNARSTAFHASTLPANAMSAATATGSLPSLGQSVFDVEAVDTHREDNVHGHLSPRRSTSHVDWSLSHRRDSFTSNQGQVSGILGPHVMDPALLNSPTQPYSNNASMLNSTFGPKPFQDRFQRDEDMRAQGRRSTHAFSPPVTKQQSNADLFMSTMSQNELSAGNMGQYNASAMDPASFHDPLLGDAYPIFGGNDFNQSPMALAEDFTAWLFNDGSGGPPGISPNGTMPNFSLNLNTQAFSTSFFQSPTGFLEGHTTESIGSSPRRLSNMIGRAQSKNYAVSESKRQELLDIMRHQFIERPHDAVTKRKEAIFEGDTSAHHHILSLTMMHSYISSYWHHQHAQLPVLHKPTFIADKTPHLLLLAIIAIGAATLDKSYGTELTDAAADFANFLAWHIRWEIVRDADFRPPAKLWVFQTLLLIEVYEKMYSTRALHERAHIHHDSTLTLMRRGSSLTGKPASTTSSSTKEDGPRADSVQNSTNVKDSQASWETWIDGEATRRVAFAAFVIDSIHCTMFGHSAKMVAHEMRLPLPCDERLWSAATPSEASRLHALFASKGIKQIMFLDGLRKTLRGDKVHTNTFGRTIIMAGLLSVSYHMTQRDVQIMSLGQGRQGTSGLDKGWKSLLLRAYDNWKKDFDESLEGTSFNAALMDSGNTNSDIDRPFDDANIFESRTVLHHLAHIAAHVDIVACQIFAGANRLLSRSVTPKDYIDIRGKVEKWATKASARDSAFYALKFITQVLMPAERFDEDGNMRENYYPGPTSPILPQAFERNRYIARDDFLLNRPWVLYVSALVVWCYGYALEGPIDPPPRDHDFATYDQCERDMKNFLNTVAAVEAPDDLEFVKGKNKCLGLLMILKQSFETTRWELTHEASKLLGLAAQQLKGESSSVNNTMTLKRRK